jgi:DNA-binding beta-propeller fold protein YncE
MVATSALATLSVIASCQDSTNPRVQGQLALLATMEGDPLTVLNVGSGTVIERPPSGLGVFGEDARALSTKSPALYYSGGGKLVKFDLAKHTLMWTEQLGAGQQARFAGQSIYANFALALSPDEKSILIADSYNLGSWGIAILDSGSREATGFLENIRVRRMITVPSGSLLPEGGVLALATRATMVGDGDSERRRGQFYLLSGTPIAIRDSIKFLLPVDSSAGGVFDLAVDGAGRFAYFTTYSRKVYKYDLIDRFYIGSIALPAYGRLAVSPDGTSIYVIDTEQSRDVPGSGFIYVVNAALNAVEAIDLNVAAREGLPPQLNSIAVSSDGLLAYVGAGTPSRGPIYGVQHGSVITIDTQNRKVKKIVRLSTWGVRTILPL